MMRPNILLVTSDQQRADCFGFENRHVRTPHLDGLAARGTRFSACITPNLACQPSRASILTGLLPLSHGVWDNGVDLDPALGAKGFAGTLAAADYDTAFIGKAHFATKATFYDYAGTRAPMDLQARSLRPLMEGMPDAREAAWSEWHVHPSRCGVGLQLRTVRTKTHKATFELASGAGEVYDLANDPLEKVNRFDDPAYAHVRRELEGLMRARPGKVLDRLGEPIGVA